MSQSTASDCYRCPIAFMISSAILGISEGLPLPLVLDCLPVNYLLVTTLRRYNLPYFSPFAFALLGLAISSRVYQVYYI